MTLHIQYLACEIKMRGGSGDVVMQMTLCPQRVNEDELASSTV